ncbi:MAG: hypothetical protein ACEPOZ_21135 [Marinifilaceae bacterium]
MNRIYRIVTSIAILLFLALPMFSQGSCNITFKKSWKSSSWSLTNGKLQGLKIETRGDIKFNKDFTDIISISDGGYLKIGMVSFGMRRKLLVKSENNRLIYSYYEGRREIPFEPKGKEWMRDVLPSVIRSTGLGAEQRVKQAYTENGIKGFLEEYEATDSDYNKSQLIKYLLSNHDLTNQELNTLLQYYPYRIDSDYELAQTLKRYNSLFLRTPELSANFFLALKEVSSDYESSQILKRVLKNNEMDDETFVLFLGAMEDISSDYEKSNIIKLAITERQINKKQMQKLLDEIDDVSSDYEKCNIIKLLIRKNQYSPENLTDILHLTESISSDYEKTQIINTLLRNQMIDTNNLQSFTDLLEEVSSDYSYKEILKDMMDYRKLGASRFDYLLRASDRISSSYDLSQFYKSLLRERDLTTEQQLQLIRKSQNISSNYELSQFLLEATQTLDMEDEDIRQEIIKAADNISSEYDYGKVMKAINAHTKKWD